MKLPGLFIILVTGITAGCTNVTPQVSQLRGIGELPSTNSQYQMSLQTDLASHRTESQANGYEMTLVVSKEDKFKTQVSNQDYELILNSHVD